MRAAFLFLLFLFECATAGNTVKWEECGDTIAFCRVPKRCHGGTSEELKEFFKSDKNCNIGMHIKPESTTKWTISIVNEETTNPVIWNIGEEVVVCTGNKAVPSKKLESEKVSLTYEPLSTKYTHCVFTLTRQTKLSEVFGRLRSADSNPTEKSELVIDGKALVFNADYRRLDNDYLRCDVEELFDSSDKSCSASEQCVDPEPGANVECPTSYTLLFRKDDKSDFIPAKLKCAGGKFLWSEPNSNSFSEVEDGQKAKCARKKCALCTPREQFKDLRNETLSGPCEIMTCPENKAFMVISTASKQLTTTDPVKCSDNNKVSKETLTDFPDVEARWTVGDKDDVDITEIECKERISCDRDDHTKIVSQCNNAEKTEHNCTKTDRDGTGAYFCEEGYTMYAIVSDSEVSIDPPFCDIDGTWNVTDVLTNTSIPIDELPELSIKCYQDAAPKKAAPSSSSLAWIIALVALLILIIIAIVVGVYCYQKRKKPKTAASLPTKTSTASKTSSKPSTSENEPLTSAMVSVTGDSVQTAKPKTPVLLAKMDIRAMTAASSDPSTNKEEKKDKSDRVEKTCEVEEMKDDKRKPREQERATEKDSYFDETSKKQDDVTSTKEKVTAMGPSQSGEDLLQSRTGGDGESQADKGNGESAKLLPKQRGAPRKYSASKNNAKPKITSNKDFLNVTDSEDEPSRTGSKKPGKKRK